VIGNQYIAKIQATEFSYKMNNLTRFLL